MIGCVAGLHFLLPVCHIRIRNCRFSNILVACFRPPDHGGCTMCLRELNFPSLSTLGSIKMSAAFEK